MPDGFISHFYSVSEHVSPVLAFGFLGPKPQLSEVCAFFKVSRVRGRPGLFPEQGCAGSTGGRSLGAGRGSGRRGGALGGLEGVRAGGRGVARSPGQRQPCPQHQIVQYLRDMFDLDNVRYTSVPALADDILQLSRRRSDILLGYLGAPVASSAGLNGALPRENGPLEELP